MLISASIFCATRYIKKPLAKYGLLFVCCMIVGAFAMHQVPGFHNWALISRKTLSHGAIPFSMYLNIDKSLIAILVAFFLCQHFDKKIDILKILKQTATPLLSCLTIVSLLSLYLEFVKVDIKLHQVFIFWALHNLFIVCISEEIIFRGWLQNILGQVIAGKNKNIIALILTSVIFGIAHFSGGILYVALATIADLHYGYAYIKTNRLQSSIIVHFALNAFHFIGFTYPTLAKF